MSSNNKETAEHTTIENVGHALTSAEQFIEKNKKVFSISAIAIIAVVGIIFAYSKLYVGPMQKEAYAQMFVAEQYFEKDSFELALNGDGNNWGFIKIIEEYGPTKAANLAHYYAGISYLHLGKFEEAIDELKKFNPGDKMIGPIAKGAIGDAYAELGNLDKALSFYLKAAKSSKNDFTSPIYLMKAGQICESKGNYKKALEIYNQIKTDFPRSNEGRTIDKYIERASQLSSVK